MYTQMAACTNIIWRRLHAGNFRSHKLLRCPLHPDFIVLSVMPAVAEDSCPQVLILSSFSKDHSWTDEEMTGFMEVYHREVPGALEPMIEYMDSDRYPEKEDAKLLLDIYRYRYSGKKLDAVVVLDAPALDFAIEHRAELFPDAYLIFAGINSLNESLSSNHDGLQAF